MKKTRVFFENGETYNITAEYGFETIGNQDPYFAITADIHRIAKNGRKVWEAGGCLHEDIHRLFPSLRPLIKWHLFGKTKGPIHYKANARYWHE